ncbi:MAG: hypothetical protein U0903_06550 [Planctomycetales bacterium]
MQEPFEFLVAELLEETEAFVVDRVRPGLRGPTWEEAKLPAFPTRSQLQDDARLGTNHRALNPKFAVNAVSEWGKNLSAQDAPETVHSPRAGLREEADDPAGEICTEQLSTLFGGSEINGVSVNVSDPNRPVAGVLMTDLLRMHCTAKESLNRQAAGPVQDPGS